MIGVHVGDGAVFGGDEVVGARHVGQHVGGPEVGRPREAAVEMGGGDLQAPEREIAEARIELGLGMARQEPTAHARIVLRVA